MRDDKKLAREIYDMLRGRGIRFSDGAIPLIEGAIKAHHNKTQGLALSPPPVQSPVGNAELMARLHIENNKRY